MPRDRQRVHPQGEDPWRGVAVVLNASRGKGSHQTLYFGTAFTVMRNPKDELKTGTLHAMCTQLGIKVRDL
jgi:mRNA interferase HicA